MCLRNVSCSVCIAHSLFRRDSTTGRGSASECTCRERVARYGLACHTAHDPGTVAEPTTIIAVAGHDLLQLDPFGSRARQPRRERIEAYTVPIDPRRTHSAYLGSGSDPPAISPHRGDPRCFCVWNDICRPVAAGRERVLGDYSHAPVTRFTSWGFPSPGNRMSLHKSVGRFGSSIGPDESLGTGPG
jgi:hypothetical protein